jgi:phosphoglycerate dehydrogenase-like enzyme
MHVSAWSPRLDPDRARPAGVTASGLDALLATSEAVSLHLRLVPETRGLLDADRIRLLTPGSLLVNTARAGLLDTSALREAVVAGRLGGLAIDVFDAEPPPPDDPLCHHPAVLATPHMAWMTGQAVDRFVAAAAGFACDGVTGPVRRVG